MGIALLENLLQKQVFKEIDSNATSVEVLASLVSLTLDEFIATRDPNTSKKTLARLANSDNLLVQILVAKHPNTSPETLKQFVEMVKQGKQFGTEIQFLLQIPLIQNQNTPSEALAFFAESENEDVRCAVARNPNTPPEVLLKLKEDRSLLVQQYAEENPNTPLTSP